MLRAGQQLPKDKPASESWAQLLDVPKEDTGLLLRRIGHVMTLPAAIKVAMSNIEDLDHRVYLKWLPRVVASFGVLNFQMQWKQFIDRFYGEVMYGMEICSDRLSREIPEKTADEKLISNLLEKVNEMLSEVEKSGHEGSTWVFIRDHLIQIKEAIEEYKIRGIKPLEAAFENTVGAVVLKPEIYKESQKTEMGKRFWQIMGYLTLVVTITVGTIQIGKDVVSILPPPDTNKSDLDEPNSGEAEEEPQELNDKDTIHKTET